MLVAQTRLGREEMGSSRRQSMACVQARRRRRRRRANAHREKRIHSFSAMTSGSGGFLILNLFIH